MNYATFFDCRAIFGETALLEELRGYMETLLEKASERFFINLGHNALQYEPPLTFFRKIKTEEIDGEKQLNLKKTMRPIVDLARVYALKHKILKTNTIDRLEALREKGVFTPMDCQELVHAFDYLMNLRLENQSLSILDHKLKPKNFLKIKDLTKVQQVTLIEIFKVIEEFQSRIKLSFTRSL
jgi:CBS domain-containing protein